MNKEISEILTGFKRTLSLIPKQEKTGLLIASLIMVITGILTNLPALILGRLVDKLTNTLKIDFNTAIPFIILIILVIVVKEVLTVFRKYLVENIATQSEKEQTIRIINRLLKADISGFLYQQHIGALHGRTFRSIQGLVKIIKLSFLDFLPIFFTAIAAVIIVLLQKPLIASVMILVIPAGLFLIIKQVSSQKGIRILLLRDKENIDGRVVEMLGGIETIRVNNTVSFEVEKIEQITERLRKTEIKHHIYMALFDAAKYLNEGFFYILVIVISIFLAANGVITKGEILIYSLLFISITSPLREIHRILDEAHESSIRVNDLFGLLNQPSDISFLTKNNSNQKGTGELILQTKNLSFHYSDRDKNGILNNLSLDIKKGEKIGIAGASGCGKTTFIHILLRLLHGYSGEVYLFGKKLTDIDREEIADKIAYVPQRPFIFSGTIKENIIYGSIKNISSEKIINATKKASIYEEINYNLGGFDGEVDENGNNLSGGQRQRLAIARIILQSPELIIFDEATSALDNTNEVRIQKNIEEIFRGKTIILIAHRLSTLKNCDRILVFDEGEIAQDGTFDKLAKSKGLFQDFLKQKDRK